MKTEAEIAEMEREIAGQREWIENLCTDLCKMEDALGFRHDQFDKNGQWRPTIEPWLERIRDLIAVEGELGDLKERIRALASDSDTCEAMLLRGLLYNPAVCTRCGAQFIPIEHETICFACNSTAA